MNRGTRNLLIIGGVALAVYYLFIRNRLREGYEAAPADFSYTGPDDMMMLPNDAAFGITDDAKARWENLSMRPEYQKAPGGTHICKCGLPSKRIVDAYAGSHHRLTHICAACNGQEEPVQLGHWWTRKGCGDPTSRGLNVLPYCTRCGN